MKSGRVEAPEKRWRRVLKTGMLTSTMGTRPQHSPSQRRNYLSETVEGVQLLVRDDFKCLVGEAKLLVDIRRRFGVDKLPADSRKQCARFMQQRCYLRKLSASCQGRHFVEESCIHVAETPSTRAADLDENIEVEQVHPERSVVEQGRPFQELCGGMANALHSQFFIGGRSCASVAWVIADQASSARGRWNCMKSNSRHAFFGGNGLWGDPRAVRRRSSEIGW